MAILVVGSVALDTVETPRGKREDLLGGSATYFAVAASKFTQVNIVGVVGQDFPNEHIEFLRGCGVDLSGLEYAPGETFRWSGRYSADMNHRETLKTCLNVFAGFEPTIPEGYRESRTVFLANIDPDLQSRVLAQIHREERIVGLDTMNFWIQRKRQALAKALLEVDILTVNEEELKLLCGEQNVWAAGRVALGLGPDAVVCKRGEYGSVLFTNGSAFALPAFGTRDVVDPTGAGDSFAGAFFGYLDGQDDWQSDEALTNAQVLGTVVASFTVEGFGVDALANASKDAILARRLEFGRLCRFRFDFPA